jgi:hypothetical protein
MQVLKVLENSDALDRAIANRSIDEIARVLTQEAQEAGYTGNVAVAIDVPDELVDMTRSVRKTQFGLA